MPVTQRDIARHLNISRTQAGFALRGDGRVAEETRQRVLQAAAELGYEPHSNWEARVLASRRSGRPVLHGAIGYVPFWQPPDLPYWAGLQGGIHEALDHAGFELMMLRADSKRGWEKVDGVLVHIDYVEELHRSLPAAIPFVSMMLPAKGVPSVAPDEADGIRQAVRHLVALGHRRIGYLVHCEIVGQETITPTEMRRLAAYEDALRGAGIRRRKEWVGNLRDYGDFVLRGAGSMREWIEDGWQATGCTALLVQNDRAAIGAMEALHEAGYRVPEDVSVVGFDGTSECLLARPHLTSVRADLHGIGAAATELLIRQINGDAGGSEAKMLPMQLEVRASTAPPKDV